MVANRVKNFNPTDVLTHERRWGGLAKLMRCISHYRSFRDAMTKIEDESEDRYALRRRGACLLAEHLEITPETLAAAIREDLLRQAQLWRWSLRRRNLLIENAWPFFQTDVGIGMEWLCKLTGKTLEYYLEEWQYSHRAEEGWAELQMVLPYAFFNDRAKFLQMAPIYLGKFSVTSSARQLTKDSSLRELVDFIRGKNYSFLNLLGAFRQLHEELSHTPDKKGGLDFRERRPLDSYAVVAFRAETCLREKLEQIEEMKSVKKHGLEGYILALSKRVALSEEAQKCFERHTMLAQLRETPFDAIDRIQDFKTGLDDGEHEIVQAFIATCLARNYFAHHRYLDRELLRSDKSAFVLGGILLTVLFLLA